MAGASYLEAVKKKIKSLQELTDDAESRSARLQEELAAERAAREAVNLELKPLNPRADCLSGTRSVGGG